MNKYILISLALISILFSCTNTESNPIEAKEYWVIDQKGVGVVQIGKSISLLEQEVKVHFETKEHKGALGFDIIDGEDVLVKVSAVQEIAEITEIYSDKFSTIKGVRVGMTIEEIEKIYPDFAPQMDPHNGRVYFQPKDLQSKVSRFTVYFIQQDDSPVWPFKKTADGDSFLFEPNGEIDKKSVIETMIIEAKRKDDYSH
ncbi:MAG: hypothetical protein EP338_03040 [Bacteroidetes bacterium]|nr:MAG: hypothetical protein EP338_03040 [Bacteroidota bacterium]